MNIIHIFKEKESSMIMLIDKTTADREDTYQMKRFENDEALWQHTHKRARLACEDGEAKWRFTFYPPYTLADFVENRDGQFFRERVEKAISQKQSMVIIHQGRDKEPVYLLATPELDVAKLKRDWCKLYAKNHGLMIVIE
jgi:hypothetical protein